MMPHLFRQILFTVIASHSYFKTKIRNEPDRSAPYQHSRLWTPYWFGPCLPLFVHFQLLEGRPVGNKRLLFDGRLDRFRYDKLICRSIYTDKCSRRIPFLIKLFISWSCFSESSRKSSTIWGSHSWTQNLKKSRFLEI